MAEDRIIAPKVEVGKKDKEGPHGARVAADVNNPSGIIIDGKYKEYETPEEGVADTQARLADYINGKGLMKGIKPTLNNIVGMWVNGKPGSGFKVMDGAYINTVQDELASMGYELSLNDKVPLEALEALTRGIIRNEAGPKADMFLGGNEKSPFDYDLDAPPAEEAMSGDESPFGANEPLPEHIQNWQQQAPSKGNFDIALEKGVETVKDVANNPAMGAAGLASGLIQKYGTMPNVDVTASPYEQARAGAPATPTMQPDPNARVMQGTVEDGLTGRARQGYNDITSLRSQQARQSQSLLNNLELEGKINPQETSRIISQANIGGATPSGVLAPQNALDDLTKRLREEAVGKSKGSVVQRIFSQAKEVPHRLVGLSSRYPIATNTLSGIGAGLSAREFKERMQEGDIPGMAVSGLNTVAGGLGMIPAMAPTNPLSAGLDVAKGVGMAGELLGLPLELAYRKWRAANPLPSVVKEYNQKKVQKKAEGGPAVLPLSLQNVYYHRKARGGSV
jgi:hypothetical protein